MKSLHSLTMVLLLLFAGDVRAHGPQMQLTNTGGKIATREVLIDDYSAASPEKRAYVMPLREVDDLDFGPSWRALPGGDTAQPWGPGAAYGVDATFPTNSTLTIRFLEELRVWDGGAFVSAGATELGALRTSNPGASSLTGNAGFTGGADASAEVAIGGEYDAGAHASVTYVLLGEGDDPTAAFDDGVYRATLQCSSSDPGIAPSEPFYLLLSKGADEQLGAAVDSLGLGAGAIQFLVIPEPTTAALAAAASLLAARRKKS